MNIDAERIQNKSLRIHRMCLSACVRAHSIEQSSWFEPSQEIRSVFCHFRKSPPLAPVLSQINILHTFPSYSEVHFYYYPIYA